MAKSPITRLLKPRDPAQPEIAAALEQLERLAQAKPVLQDAAALQSTILRTIYADAPRVGTLEMTHEHAAAKLHGGVPLLRNEQVPLHIPDVQAVLLRLCQAVREHKDVGGQASEIAAALREHALEGETLVHQVLEGQAAAIHERAAGLGLNGELLCTLLRFSLFPALERLAAQLAPLRASAAWGQGYCPTCGSWPLLGEYRGLEQTRFLRCGLCATGWTADRLFCPFCGSRSHLDLNYLHVEGDEQKRAVTCEHCHGYIKMLATLVAIPPAELAVHDLATLHLDMVALERGYAAPV